MRLMLLFNYAKNEQIWLVILGVDHFGGAFGFELLFVVYAACGNLHNQNKQQSQTKTQNSTNRTN
ncbi:MAG TPA: hypothetical protein VI864_03635 [Candidatus Bathyarchaeia archaeon]|nr:hypothetical protein [Candidatus Bathyarchaeia archaeon]